MKNKQDITVFVSERRKRSMLVTPSEAKRLGVINICPFRDRETTTGYLFHVI
jgi:hypothetical protein